MEAEKVSKMKVQDICTPRTGDILDFLIRKKKDGYMIVSIAPHYGIKGELTGYLVIVEKEVEEDRWV